MGKDEDKYVFFVETTKHKIEDDLVKHLLPRVGRWRQCRHQIVKLMNLAFGYFSICTFLS